MLFKPEHTDPSPVKPLCNASNEAKPKDVVLHFSGQVWHAEGEVGLRVIIIRVRHVDVS